MVVATTTLLTALYFCDNAAALFMQGGAQIALRATESSQIEEAAAWDDTNLAHHAFALAATRESMPRPARLHHHTSRTAASLMPHAWALLGPFYSGEPGADPLQAFGGVQSVVQDAPESLWEVLDERGEEYNRLFTLTGNHNRTFSELIQHNSTKFPSHLIEQLPTFPSEYGREGYASWSLAFSNKHSDEVKLETENLTAAEKSANQEISRYPGWAVSNLFLNASASLLVRCTDGFSLDDSPVLWAPDLYNENRAVHLFHLSAGMHRIFVHYSMLPFRCDVMQDSQASRSNVTNTKDTSMGKSPLITMNDFMISDIVDGHLASPYVALPVLNAATEAVEINMATVLDGPSTMKVRALTNASRVPIQSRQVFIVGLELEHEGPLTCQRQGSSTTFVLNLTIRLHPVGMSGLVYDPTQVNILPECRPFAAGGIPATAPPGGYTVTFPDFDGSIQHMWVAPPNVSTLPGGRCPTSGCPVMLSTHGANVKIGPVWGRSYAVTSRGDFPYPAWLVQPSNRYHWGTDWEGVGYDNGLAAVSYVKKFQPGAPEAMKPILLVDSDKRLNTGHSMGGHGCMVNSVHDPDRALGALCAAGWTSMQRYNSKLLNPLFQGLLQAPATEHAADYLMANMQGLPFQLIYGEKDDNVPPQQSRYMARLVDSVSHNPAAVQLVEVPKAGHWFEQNTPEMIAFYRSHLFGGTVHNGPPLPLLPESFQFVVPNPSTFGSKGNLKALQLIDAARPGKILVHRCSSTKPVLPACSMSIPNLNTSSPDVDRLWIVQTSNIRRLKFNSPAAVGTHVPLAVQLDGVLFTGGQLNTSSGQHFCLARPGIKGGSPVWKICGTSSDGRLWESVQRGGPSSPGGPLHMVLRRAPLCIVHGNGTSQADQAISLAEKLYLISRYATPILDASAVSETTFASSYCNDSNLILIGTASDNPWLSERRCAFPYVKFNKASGFSVGGRAYSSSKIGLIGLGRLSNGRQALLVSGTDMTGLRQAVMHVPVQSGRDGADYMVLGPDEAWQGNGGVLAAGFLDALWQPSGSSWANPDFQGTVDDTLDTDCTAELDLLARSDAEVSAMATDTEVRSSSLALCQHFFVAASLTVYWVLIGLRHMKLG